MTAKRLALALLIMAAALGIAQWRSGGLMGARPGSALGTRLTFSHAGTVDTLFKLLGEKSGIAYEVNPAVSARMVQGKYANQSVVQIQQDAARQAHLRYKPLDREGKKIGVDPQ